ncbi:MAG: phytanoyl-CoA dioxygenase family protein [Alphaproteobacteria bacterium]
MKSSLLGPNTYREHRPVLSIEQVESYQRDGYIAVPGAVSRDLLSRMIAATERLAAECSSLEKSNETFDLAPDHSPEAPKLRRISAPTVLDPVFFEAAFETPLQDMVADLVGGSVKYYHAKINFKQPGSHSAVVQWHQDWTHFPHTNTDLLAVSIPYYARDRRNGCLAFVDGSHRQGPLSIWQDGKYVFTCEHEMDPKDIEKATYVECEAGDAIIHHGLSVHGSVANMTEEPVVTFTAQYAAADAMAYTAPVIDSIHRNWMVRGRPATHARVEEMVVQLPPDFSGGYTSLFTNQDDATK